MPKDLAERRSRCLEWMGRPSPTSSPHASDDEGDNSTPDKSAAEVAATLLGLASGSAAGIEDTYVDEDEFAMGDVGNSYDQDLGWMT